MSTTRDIARFEFELPDGRLHSVASDVADCASILYRSVKTSHQYNSIANVEMGIANLKELKHLVVFCIENMELVLSERINHHFVPMDTAPDGGLEMELTKATPDEPEAEQLPVLGS